MATFDDLMGQVRFLLGEEEAARWGEDELGEMLVDEIRAAQLDVPDAALSDLNTSKTATGAGAASVSLTSNYRKTLHFRDETSEWDVADDLDYLESIRTEEGNLGFDDTTTRLCAVSAGALITYPAIPATETYIHKYLRWATESGTMDLPTNPNVQEIAVLGTASKAYTQKAYDLETSKRWWDEREAKLKKIRSDYGDDG